MKKTSLLVFSIFIAVFIFSSSVYGSYWPNDDSFHYGKGTLPWRFRRGDHYPINDEEMECRPIKIHVARGTKRYKDLVTFPKSFRYLYFASDDSRTMSSRLHSRLSKLAVKYWQVYRVRLLVLKAWSPFPDHSLDNTSLHYEGRSVQIHVTKKNVTRLLRLAVNYGEFDWVIYDWKGYARLSVIPDACDANLDVVFVMDQSGSIGRYNHNIALNFLKRVVDFFNIGSNLTQVGLVTYSTNARVRFDLNDFSTKSDILNQISNVRYTGGWTATALGLFQAGVILNPTEERGARPIADGIPRVVILLTDGRSNRVPIDTVATSLHDFGVQVYTVGIGNIYLPELKFIASDPDPYHIFLLDSFSDAEGFVDFLSYTTCDTPAVVEPGENTTTEVPEDGFRFFQTECTAFSVSVVIEQIDIYGKCNLYASTLKPNPGPLDNSSIVVRNEDISSDRRIVELRGVKKFIYISIRGIRTKNMFTVIIWDRIFRLEEYTVNAPEGIPNHSFFNLSAEVTVTTEMYYFRIKEGNDNGDFQIDNITGILSTNNELSIARQRKYRLVIIVENRNASCHRGKVIVNVIVVPNQLEFEPVSPVNITETATGNVTRVQAIGTSSGITYSIIGGNIGNAFAINTSSGDIRVAGSLDFETLSQYSLTIQAQSGGSSASVVQVINILDVNEQPVFITQCATMNNCRFSVFENSPASTLVGTIIARDPDDPNIPNGQLTYLLAPDAPIPQLPFTVNSTGSITVSSVVNITPLDREDISSWSFDFIARDRGSPMLSNFTRVLVTVLDVNDNAPVFRTGNTTIIIPENLLSGTPIQQYTVTDADIGNNAVVTFSLSSNVTNLPFSINNNGLLSVSGPLDFDRGLQVYNITIIASNFDGLSTRLNVSIQLTDVNDNTPQFVISPINATVVEHSPQGTFVTQVQATDIDSGANGQIVYTMTSATNLLTIDSSTGVITVNGDIDREMVTMFTLTVTAQDLGIVRRSNTTTVNIRVADINDNAPLFMPNAIQLTLAENIPLGEIITLNATDDDQENTPNSTITYSISSGNINNHFSINPSTGVLSLITPLDFEERQFFNLTILGRDGGNPSMNGSANVLITVTNINDHPPMITGNVTLTLPENEPVGSTLAQFNATDLDQMHINFSLANPSTLFAIDRVTGIVTLIGSLDFESAVSHVVTIIATDSVHIDRATLTVNVLDVNEFGPVFISNTVFSLNESRPTGTVIGTIRATDGDTNNTVMYLLVPNTVSGLFRLNSSTGVLTTASVLDREGLVEENHFIPPGSNETLVIMAIDNGKLPGPMSTLQNITIILNDINDNAPVFNPSQYTADIAENTNGTTTLFTAQATDADLGDNGLIRYSIPSSVSDSFSIDPITGELSAIRPFDREDPNNVFRFVITARDQGRDIQLMNTASVTIRVTDVNDNAPQFDPNRNYVLQVREDARVGRILIQIPVTDFDQGNNAVINLSSREGNIDCTSSSACFFSFNNNGIVRIARPLDFETSPQHNVTLIATDGGSPSLTTTQLLIINIINIDERPPEFLGSCNATILEGVSLGTLVTECQARDFDELEGEFTDDITYSIIAGNEEQVFAIDSEDGNITTNAALDREREDSYTITVQATDGGGLSTTMEVTITIGDINDNTPVFDNEPYSVFITQADIIANRMTLLTVSASDDDIGNNGIIMYDIPATIITPQDSILTVRATDKGTPIALSTNTTVNVTLATPCTIQSYIIQASTGTITATLQCSISITPSLVQVNVGNNFTLSCNILANIDIVAELIHNSSSTGMTSMLTSGETTASFTRTNVVFSNAGFYNCRVVGSSLQTSEATEVQVQVPPVITLGPTSITANEGTNNFAQFRCIAQGVPDPVITWRRNNAEVVATNRVLPSDGSLLITAIASSDSGNYTCVATNRAGQDTATASLTVIDGGGGLNLMVAEVVAMSNPDPIMICNTFNKQQFEQVMSQVTSHRTMVTSTEGTSLCPSDECHPSPCVNGTCNVTADGNYKCTCTPGFYGHNCDEDINECQNTTCLYGGTCENLQGGFQCHCPDGYYGDLCAYNDRECLCPHGADCITVEGESRCVITASSNHMIIEGVNVRNVIALDNTVNTLLEDPPSSSSSRKKRSNGFVTVCSGRFVRLSTSSDHYLLVWVCPDEATPPSDSTLLSICQSLVYSGLVRVCYPPNNGQPVRLPVVPPSRLNITIVLLDSNGNPLPSQSVIDILNSNDVLSAMSASGFNITAFRAVQVPQTGGQSANSRNVGGSIGGLIGALLVIVLIAVIVIGVLKYRKRNKRIRIPVIEMNEKGTTFNNTMFEDSEDDRYSRVPKRLMQINDSSMDSIVPIGGPRSPLGSPVNPYTLFDDSIYATPPSRKSVKKTSTLERAKQHQLQKSSSLEKLLDSREEEEEREKSTKSLEDGDEPIYGNMNFHGEGRAGERWENYWKTNTIIRGTTPSN